jgi:hypothetical protein
MLSGSIAERHFDLPTIKRGVGASTDVDRCTDLWFVEFVFVGGDNVRIWFWKAYPTENGSSMANYNASAKVMHARRLKVESRPALW